MDDNERKKIEHEKSDDSRKPSPDSNKFPPNGGDAAGLDREISRPETEKSREAARGALSRLEQDIAVKRSASAVKATKPGAVAHAPTSQGSVARLGAVSESSSSRLEQDMMAKRRASVTDSEGAATRPGAVAASRLSKVEQDVQAKQRANVGSGASKPGAVAVERLSKMEQEVQAKQRASHGSVATRPGAVSSNAETQTELDVHAKRSGSNHGGPASRPGAVSESSSSRLEQDMMTKRRASVTDSEGAATRPGAVAASRLSKVEQDVQAKQRANVGSGASKPGAVAVERLSKMEQEVQAKQRASHGSVATRPGAVSSNAETQTELDVHAKRSGSNHGGPASRPGAVSESSSSRLEQGMMTKRRASVTDSEGAATRPGAVAASRLSKVEQDVQAKQRANVGSGASKPGAVAVERLSKMEQEVQAKQRASHGAVATRPGAVASTKLSSLQQEVKAKQEAKGGSGSMEVDVVASSRLSSLEQDVQAKQRATFGSGATQPGAVAATRLSRVEQDVKAKQEAKSAGSSTHPSAIAASRLSRAEQEVRAKQQARQGARSSQPGAVSETSMSKMQQDIQAKRRASSAQGSSRPGAVQETALSRLEQDIQAKRVASEDLNRLGAASTNLSRLEQDMDAKRAATSGDKVVRPGAVAAGGTMAASSLTQREQDIRAKMKANDEETRNQPAVATISPASEFEQLVRNKAGEQAQGAKISAMGELEQVMGEKMNANASHSGATAPGVVAQNAPDHRSTQNTALANVALSRLDQEIAVKNSARQVVPLGPGPELSQAPADPRAAAHYYSQESPSFEAARARLVQSEQDSLAKQSVQHQGYSVPPTYGDALANPSETAALSNMEANLRAKMAPGEQTATMDSESEMFDDDFDPSTSNDRVIEYSGHGRPEQPYITGDSVDPALEMIPGIEAFVAPNVVEATGVAVVMSEEEEEKLDTKFRKRRLIRLGLLLVTLIIVIVVPVSLFTGGDNDGDEPTFEPTSSPSAAPSAAPTTEGLQDLIQCILDSGISRREDFEDLSSPQYSAVTWLELDDAFWRNGNLQCTSTRFLQRFALATFYYALDGENWAICGRNNPECNNREAGFLSNTDHCEWHKVGCDAGLVTTIVSFDHNAWFDTATATQLKGALPIEMQYLSSMKTFTAPQNKIRGNIDGPLRTWSEVNTVVLTRNELTGPIPESIAADSPRLEDLRLDGNELTGRIPESLGNLSFTHLRLSYNDLTGTLPANIVDKSDKLDANISGVLPQGLWAQTDLIRLLVDSNPDLSGEMSSDVGVLRNLRTLRASNTKIGGTIPDAFYENSVLEVLDVTNCRFSGPLSPDVVNFNATLMDLLLENNAFTGPIPSEELGLIAPLEFISLQGNQFTGSISRTLCRKRSCMTDVFGDNECVRLARLTVDCDIECSCCNVNEDCDGS